MVKPIVASTDSLPLVGAVEARGLTTAQLSSAIAGRLKSGLVRDPSVAVEIETYRPFFVLGEATFPGQYPYVPNMTIENAIAIAGSDSAALVLGCSLRAKGRGSCAPFASSSCCSV